MIIVIEGTDGSGKQTQTQMLFNYLKNIGKNVKTQSFPNYDSESSFFVKKYLRGELGGLNALTPKQCSSFYAIDRMLTMNNYKEFLEKDGILLLDRYVTSNMLHQASKIDDELEREKFLNWLETFEYEDLNLPKPDITFFLDLKPEISKRLREERGALKVGGEKDIHEADSVYMKNCYERGMKIAKDKNWQVIKCYENDNILTIEEIHNKIKEVLKV